MSWIWSVAIRRNSNRDLANCLPLCTTCMGWILIHNFDSFQIFCRRVTSRSWILKPSISNMSRHIAGQVPQLTLHKTSIYIYIAYKAITRIQGFRNVDICFELICLQSCQWERRYYGVTGNQVWLMPTTRGLRVCVTRNTPSSLLTYFLPTIFTSGRSLRISAAHNSYISSSCSDTPSYMRYDHIALGWSFWWSLGVTETQFDNRQKYLE